MSSDKTRIQMDFCEHERKRLDNLVSFTGAASRTEVVRRALGIYSIMLGRANGGDRIVIKAKDGSEREMLLPEGVKTHGI